MSRRKEYLTPKEFGLTLDPPASPQRICLLARQKRIVGAKRDGFYWKIPRGAIIRGSGRRAEWGKNRGVSASEYAKMHGVSRQRVYKLLRQGRIEGAKHKPHGWDIMPDTPWPAAEDGKW